MKYRLATMEDANDLLRWKNQADTRKFSLVSQKRILKKNHLKWLEKTLQEGTMQIWVLPGVGNVRIEGNEIAIGVGKEFYGQGVGTKMIRHFSKSGMTAKIVDGNVASMRLFLKCGYKPISHAVTKTGVGYYTLCKK